MKASNISSSFDMIKHALNSADTVADGYVYVNTFGSLVWSYVNNTQIIASIAGRRRMTEKQTILHENLSRDLPDLEHLMAWVYHEATELRGAAPDYSRQLENSLGYKSKDELKAEAEVRYETLPKAKRVEAVNIYVSSKFDRTERIIEDYEIMIAGVVAKAPTIGVEPNWFLTRFILNSIQRNLVDYTTIEGIEIVAERAGFDDDVINEHILMLPVAEQAYEDIGAMLERIEQTMEREGPETQAERA